LIQSQLSLAPSLPPSSASQWQSSASWNDWNPDPSIDPNYNDFLANTESHDPQLLEAFSEQQTANLKQSFSIEFFSTEGVTAQNILAPKSVDLLSPQGSSSNPSQTATDELSTNGDPPRDRSNDAPAILAQKRHRNNIAARKYRQKRIDRITELDLALEKMTKDRNNLRVLLAKREAEVAVLKDIIQGKHS